jgi:hypothetical protein
MKYPPRMRAFRDRTLGLSAVIVAASLIVPLSPAISAPRCDPELPPLPGDRGYKFRGNRCEGFYNAPISGRDIELVALVRGNIRYELDPSAVIYVQVPKVSPVPHDSAVSVRAVALALHAYYRMDAVVPAGGVLQWPVKDVLLQAGLGANRIGVFGWLDSGAHRLFVPLGVTTSTAKAAAQPARLVVRSAVDTQRILWRSRRADSSDKNPPEWHVASPEPVRAGQPVVIELDTGPPARYHVEVSAQERTTSRWLSPLMIEMVLPGEP